jgi:hypothetical protein
MVMVELISGRVSISGAGNTSFCYISLFYQPKLI